MSLRRTISLLAPACTLLLACTPTSGGDANEDESSEGDGDGDAASASGDGDGDSSSASGDGDGDSSSASGDGDGDSSSASGDGDGDGSGDGDGDGSGDGDGDTGDGDGDGDGSTGDGDGDPPPPLSNDPYDPESCEGLAWDEAAASEALGGMERIVLDDAIMQIRERVCQGDDCGEWQEAEDWTLDYLSYSGGVTTHWTPYLMDMNFVLFDDNGTPTLSLQHQSFAAGNYPDTEGALYGFPPEVINYPHLRAYNEFPLYQNDYDDLDYQAKDGTLILGESCARWIADPYGTGTPYETQYAILFRW